MARKSRKNLLQTAPEAPKAVIYAAWGYTRISIDGERSEDSIESQTDIIKDYVSDKADLDLRGVITDLGFTGRDFDRPGYTELMDGIKRGEVQCVIVKDLSRVGRTYIEVGELLFDTFPAYNVRFISVNDQYDSFADDAARKKLLILFKNLINHMYSRDLGKKIRSAHDAKKQRGELAGIPPYGYIRGGDGITLAFDGDAADTVKMIFDMRLAGVSANKIAKHLNREGVPSPQYRRYLLGQITHEKYSKPIKWNVGMVSRMLQNETYTGALVQGKYDCDGKRHILLSKEQWIKHENKHPGIVGREQFDAVQRLMLETMVKYERGKGEILPENHYAGKIFCQRCGKAVVRVHSGHPGQPLFYYVCRFCIDEIKAEKGLKRVSNYPLAKLDAFIMKSLQEQINTLIDFDKLMGRLVKSETLSHKKTELLQERTKWEKTTNGADKMLSAAYAHHLDGLLDLREFELVRAKVERDKHDAAARLAYVTSELNKYDDMADRHSHWRKAYNSFKNTETPTKELIQALVGRIELVPLTNDVIVTMNYNDGLTEYRGLLEESGVSESA